ncbi:GGDEF domain-containing protein [Alkalihalobacterium chitinilyticum]|uniref:GGDEF domain-containing protein n=1 Tax=Alkalihalobacterium chitinilyticum TaxID=2980103 RepID=A0ABT5VBD0_9BACI|nr:diguanylate cyclase [Alkalihalobacterium chitinilyticum]MDE5412745.1 GGDEF domain-containing protein [Alkalihalobacterium chitinilyticum]
MYYFIHEMFANAAILSSFIFFAGYLNRDVALSVHSPLRTKLLVGVLSSLLGIILMQYSIQISEAVIDLRYFSIMLAAYIAGFIPAIIAALIVGFARLLFWGLNLGGIIAFSTMLLVGIGCGVCGEYFAKQHSRKWLYMTLYSTLIGICTLYILVKDLVILFQISFIFILTGIFLMYCLRYVRDANENYRAMKQHSYEDELTGLTNVRGFNKAMKEFMSDFRDSEEKKHSFLLIDIDHFKMINDTYGHLNGDLVLKRLGQILQLESRGTDIVSRNGGEEFSILLPNCEKEDAVQIAKRIRKSVEGALFHINSTQLNVTVSIGVSSLTSIDMTPEQLVQEADECLYFAKRSGRNLVGFRLDDKFMTEK